MNGIMQRATGGPGSTNNTLLQNTTSSSGSSYGYISWSPFFSIETRPTRDGMTHVFATWNSYNTHVTRVTKVMLYYTTTTSYDAIIEAINNNDYSSLSNFEAVNITSKAGDGELYDTYHQAGYYVFGEIQFYLDNGTDSYAQAFQFGDYSNILATSSKPQVSFSNNTITIGTLMTGRRIIEFRRTDIPYGNTTGITNQETLIEMFYTSLLNMEYENPYISYYNLGSVPRLSRWRPGSYTVGVNFKSTINQSQISSAINNAISQVNSVMREFNISFTRSGTSGNVNIIVDTEYNLYGIDLDVDTYAYGGTWTTTKDSSYYITSATVKLASDIHSNGRFIFSSYETIAFEEFLQAMGAGFDQVEYPHNTIHTDVNYFNKQSTMYTKDANILRLVYSSLVNAGDTYYDVCRKLNIPKGAYMPSTSTTNSVRTVDATTFLERGGTYDIRAFIVNSSGKVSATSDWISITIPKVTVKPWSWSSVNVIKGSNGRATAAQLSQFYKVLQGTALPENGFSYKVWNDLVDKVAEVREATGRTWLKDQGYGQTGCYVSSGDAMSASKYNEVRVQVGTIISTTQSGYPSCVVSNNGEIFGYHIKRVADVANEIIDTML